MDEETASLLRQLDKRVRGRDHYLSFPTRFCMEGIEEEFFSRFLVVAVARQKYPAFFQLVRRLRSRMIALPCDTISERVEEELDRNRIPLLLLSTDVPKDRYERVDGLNVCVMDVALEEFEQIASDPFMGDIFPPEVVRGVRKAAQT